MRDLFSCDSKFMQILHTISDHILLNLLFIICCIPVVTIGAAQAGLYSGIRVLRDEEDDSSCFRAFWKGFGIGFGKITFVWLGTALIAGLSGSCLLYQMTLEQTDYVLLFPCLIIPVLIPIVWSATSKEWKIWRWWRIHYKAAHTRGAPWAMSVPVKPAGTETIIRAWYARMAAISLTVSRLAW
jgi:hypothetical protein